MVFARTRWGWDPKGWAAVVAYTTFSLMMANFLVGYILAFVIPRKWPTSPDALHSYPIRFKGGAVYFVQPWLAKYFENDIWIGLAFLGLFFLLMWLHRDEVTRYD
jgi:hypothetical protein